MVRATLSLIETARSSGIDFRYFCLLSGDCYPLKKREEIEAIITEGGEEFVQVYRDLRLSQSWVVGRRHFYDMVFLNPRAERSQPDWFLPWNAASILAKKVFKVLERERKYPFSFIPWKGNQFWCLSKECVTYVLSFLKKNSDFVRYHRTTFAPDEVALQTIVCQSEFSKRLARRPLRFGIYKEIDSGREWPFDEMQRQAPNPPERMEGPKILTLSDWKRIEISQALFARKFDEKKSAEVLEKIDRERLGV